MKVRAWRQRNLRTPSCFIKQVGLPLQYIGAVNCPITVKQRRSERSFRSIIHRFLTVTSINHVGDSETSLRLAWVRVGSY